MAKKVAIEWKVFDKSTNERIKATEHATMVNQYSEIQPKVIDKVSANYEAKELEKDLKIEDKLGPDMDRGGYTTIEIEDDPKEHDILISVEVLSH